MGCYHPSSAELEEFGLKSLLHHQHQKPNSYLLGFFIIEPPRYDTVMAMPVDFEPETRADVSQCSSGLLSDLSKLKKYRFVLLARV